MKLFPKSLFQFVVFTFFLAASSSCSRSRHAPVKDPLPGLEAQLSASDETTFEARQAELAEKAKSLLSLVSDKKQYPACVVYTCRELTEEFVCLGSFADDTIHIAEFPETCSAIEVINSQLQISEQLGVDPEKMVFYLGDPGEMHQSGYATIRKIVVNGDVLKLPKELSEAQVLFTIIKRQQDLYYKKYVWLIGVKSTTQSR